MTSLLVSDTSVLIDLDRGGLLEGLFRLPAAICVPDVLYASELQSWKGEYLKSLGLRVLELDGDGTARAQSYLTSPGRISVPDAFALALAKSGGWVLLTGDGYLREAGEKEGVTCHGVLWVLDQLEAGGIVEASGLCDGLTRLSRSPRARLPRDEVRRRIERYRRATRGPRSTSR